MIPKDMAETVLRMLFALCFSVQSAILSLHLFASTLGGSRDLAYAVEKAAWTAAFLLLWGLYAPEAKP
jgi:hypothetical protein